MIVAQNLIDNSDIHAKTKFEFLQNQLRHTLPDLSREASPAWQSIINNASEIEQPEDTSILQPNTSCKQFMLLLAGTVRVFQQTPDDREVTLYRLNAGDLCVLSINSLLHRKAFGAFARAETPIRALILSKEQFFEALTASQVFQEYVLVSLSDRFHDLLELMENTVFESLDTRLICLLGRMSRASGTDTIHITHAELARELASSREVISRLLKALERRGCIKLGRGSIQLTG